MNLVDAQTIVQRLRHEVSQVFIGQPEIIDQVLCALLAGGHVLLEGVPGLGKTLLVKALARSVDASFSRIQFTPDLMPADVTGHTLFDSRTNEFSTRKGPVFANFVLADEINRAPAKTQAALLEVMQEGQVTLNGETHSVPPPFLVLATQNPIEQEGTYPLPEAQLDRFLLKILIDYPSQKEELALVSWATNGRIADRLDVQTVQAVTHAADLLVIQMLVAGLRIDDAVLDYAVRIVRATREWPGIAIGAGPRGAIALVRTARAHALLSGHDYVLPDDIKAIAPAALRHRLTQTPEAQIEGLSMEQIIHGLLDRVEAPRA